MLSQIVNKTLGFTIKKPPINNGLLMLLELRINIMHYFNLQVK